MKKTALLIIALVGVGLVLVPGGAGAVDLFNTNIVGAANTTTADAWVISDTTATDYVITNSTISASNGNDRAWIASPTTGPQGSLGRGGLMSSWTALHNVTVTDSAITGSDGGNMTVVSNVIGSLKFYADGGDGMLLKNVNGVFNNATILGGNGGTIIASAAGKSTANAGFGLTLRGGTSTLPTTLHATNSIFNGGNGGEIRTPPTTGDAVGGDGILVDEANSTVILDLSDDTQVIGGNGGSVSVQEKNPGKAGGGNASLVTGSGKKTVTINGGTFVGGKGGTIAGQPMEDGKSLFVTGTGQVNLTLAGGNFDDGVLIANTAASTLALKSTFTNDTPLLFQGDTLKITEWTDGQLSDVRISGKTAYYVELAGTNEFNLSGSFIIGGNAIAKFSSGLVVESGGTLDLGSSQAANEATSVYIKTNSTIISSFNGRYMGTLRSSGSLTIDAGTEWIINDIGTATSGTTFDLATADVELTSHLLASDVHYVTTKAFPDYYLTISDIVITGSTVRVTCAERDLIDNDSDGLDDEQELYYYGTSPSKTDSDNDGLSDGEEINHGTDPFKSDSENDGLSDGEEINFGTDPLKSDSDNDGLSDGEEINLGTAPLDVDSDKDYLTDGYEVNTSGTNPSLYDTDGDGYSDSTLFVRQNSGTNANAPYNHWTSAATNIQDALQYAEDNWTILIDDGNYLLNNTIVVSKRVTIQSLNGPKTTIVNGQGTVRCFSLGNTACVIEGLTITNGYSSDSGGGIYCSDTTPVVTNCILSGNLASSSGGGMYYGTANNCTITGNTANWGEGGGMSEGTANNCILSGNSASYGGGMYDGTANNCILSGNSASYGGGMYYGTANNCTITGNTANWGDGGGMSEGTANNCILSGNSAYYGGGMYYGTANNCTLSGNSAQYGGGIYDGTANNCIVWYNTAPSGKDLSGTTASYSCSPDVTHGSNSNITNAPVLVSSSHIAADSPCRGAGSANYATGTDIDGEGWTNPPSMGCDEPADFPAGAIEVAFVVSESMVASGYPVRFQEQIHGALSAHVWDFGDGTQITNSLFVEHAWAAAGTFDVVLTAYNADWSDGVSATQEVVIVDAEETAIYVSTDGDNAHDGTSWANAKKTIQAGVDAQIYAGGFVRLRNGTYFLKATITVSKPVRIVGVDGAESTIVDGRGSVRCFNLGNTACVIEGLTITNGYSSSGGGIYCSGNVPVVTNCTITGNTANWDGGGMVYGTANNCTISGNTADYGGGMYDGTANNCILSGNSAEYGGGMYDGTANNCILSGNSAQSGGGMYFGTANNSIVWYNTEGSDLVGTTARYSCSPDVTHDMDGNITNAPMLLSSSHIAADSPCRGAGCAEYTSGTDIDGEAWTNPPSIGCDEPADVPGGLLKADFVSDTLVAAADYSVRFREQIHGALFMNIWDFGDGTRMTNSIIPMHAWAIPGKYDVVLTAYNADWSDGVSATQEVVIVDAVETAIYVSTDGDDANDGTSWARAKKTIQAGVDAQIYTGGFVRLRNGTYFLTETITVSKPVRIVGVDGPESTIVDGQGIVGCFNLGNTSCEIEGLTITNGYSSNLGGGIYCSGNVPVVTNCTISGNSAQYGGGMYSGTANQCTIRGNTATYYGGGMHKGTASNCTISGNTAGEGGGGMYSGTANNCTFSGNSAGYGGGGMYEGTASNCTFSGNTAEEVGGGMHYGTANNCTITKNRADYGGGMFGGTANNCILSGNSASQYGGGMYSGTADNCTINGNTATEYGGGMYDGTANNCILSGNSAGYGGGMIYGTANNCTLSGNKASSSGGGIYYGTAINCIIWYNTAPSEKDLYDTTAISSCSPDVRRGFNGNITTAPLFVDAASGDYRLAAGSPCIDVGQNGYVVGSLDLAGMPRVVGGRVDMGAYEYYSEDDDEDGDGMPNWWEATHFGSILGSAPTEDFDNDLLDNISEWIAGTNPSDPDSAFTASVSTNQIPTGFVIEWTSIEDRSYSVLWRKTLTNDYKVLQEGIEYPQNSYTDTVHNAESTSFYHIEVQLK